MSKFSDNLPTDIKSYFDSFSHQLELNNLSTFQFGDLKSLSIIQLAKSKFFNFSKIMCGFLYACEQAENMGSFFDKTYGDFFEELIQDWLQVLYSKELFEKVQTTLLINLPFYEGLEGLQHSFGDALKKALNSQTDISIISLYKLWIKNLDKYYENLLTRSIDLLDSNTTLHNLRKIND